MIAKERALVRRLKCRQEGKCISCMSKPARPNSARCEHCASLINANSRKRVAKAISSGTCLDCDNKAFENQRYCEDHRKLNNKRVTIKRQEHKLLGLCILCDEPIVGISDVCKLHYFKRSAFKNLGSSKKWSVLSEQLDKQNNKCLYCSIVLNLGVDTQTDHYNSRSKHPELANDPNNIVWACEPCNQAKGDMTGPEFIALCKRVVATWPN